MKPAGLPLSLCLCLCLSLCFSGCTDQQLKANAVAIDASPAGCGYRWFQTGTSPEIRRGCDLPRDTTFRRNQEAEAIAHAWSVAELRCPEACPPRELQDTSTWEEPYPDGVCRDDRVYYTARVFFQCAE